MENIKVVVNRCFGGFGLSKEAKEMYASLKGKQIFRYMDKSKDYKNREYVRGYGDDWHGCPLLQDIGDNPTSEELNSAEWLHDSDIPRDDKDLVQVVESLKEKANGMCAKLSITEIPTNIERHIEEYDGSEHIAENHQTW